MTRSSYTTMRLFGLILAFVGVEIAACLHSSGVMPMPWWAYPLIATVAYGLPKMIFTAWSMALLLIAAVRGRNPFLAIQSALAAGLMIALIMPVSTYAADGSTIDLTPVWQIAIEYLTAALGAVITVLIGRAVAVLKAKTGVEIEEKYRDSLHSAAMTGVTAALSALGGKLPSSMDGKSALIAEGVSWVEKSVPDALAHFGLGSDQIEKLVASKLQQIIGTTGTGTAG